MVPIGPRFEQQRRLVRDLAASSGKPMRLLTEGRDVEIDASLIEHIKDPLTHLIRNAADHAIEPPEVRQRKAKDPVATIHLRAFYDGGGRGRAGRGRRPRVRRARHSSAGARARHGAAEAGAAEGRDPRLRLRRRLHHRGEGDEISGRGVGMDVVYRNIVAMRGTVSISTHEGVSSTISIRLPLTLAILDGLAVAAGGERFLVPMQAIRECMVMPDGHDPRTRRNPRDALPRRAVRAARPFLRPAVGGDTRAGAAGGVGGDRGRPGDRRVDRRDAGGAQAAGKALPPVSGLRPRRSSAMER